MKLPDLNELYYFAQVVEHGGFAPAGRALGLVDLVSRLHRGRVRGVLEFHPGHRGDALRHGLGLQCGAARGRLVAARHEVHEQDDHHHRHDEGKHHRPDQLLGRLDRPFVGAAVVGLAHGILGSCRSQSATHEYTARPGNPPPGARMRGPGDRGEVDIMRPSEGRVASSILAGRANTGLTWACCPLSPPPGSGAPGRMERLFRLRAPSGRQRIIPWP